MLWRSFFLLLTPIWLPLIVYQTISLKSVWKPINPMAVFVAILLNVYLPTFDNYSDVSVGLQYYHSDECNTSNTSLALIIIMVTFLPSVVRALIEVKNTIGWIFNEPDLFLALWNEILLDQTKNVISILPFVSNFLLVLLQPYGGKFFLSFRFFT